MLDSNDGIMFSTSDVEVLYLSLGTADGSILWIDEVTEIGPVVFPYGG